MWGLYARGGQGVAISTSYKRLRESFRRCPADVHLGVVHYIDYETELIPWRQNVMYPLLHKRKSFDHERELRALVTDLRSLPDDVIAATGVAEKILQGSTQGEYVPIDLEALLGEVYTGPFTEDWFSDLVESVLRRFATTVSLCRSQLDQGPSW